MNAVKSFTRLTLGVLATVGLLSFVLAQPSRAEQQNRVDPLQDFNNPNSSDPFSRANQGDNFGVMDLMRNMIQNSGQNQDYSAEQSEDFDSAAAKFHAQQRKLLQQQQTYPRSVSPTR